MRRVFVLTALALALPLSAWGSGIDLVSKNGTISISSAGITSKGSQLVSFNGITAPAGHTLGSVSLSTGALMSGTLATGGTFSSAGSSFLVIGKGNFGQPKGVIFSGAFVGPIMWTLVSQQGQSLTLQLTGGIMGVLFNGRTVTGTTTQTIFTTKNQLAGGIAHIRQGMTQVAIPEPSTLGLLGTGLVGISGVMRRRLLLKI